MARRGQARGHAEPDLALADTAPGHSVKDRRWNQEDRALESQFLRIVEGKEIPKTRVSMEVLFCDVESNRQIRATGSALLDRKEADFYLDADPG